MFVRGKTKFPDKDCRVCWKTFTPIQPTQVYCSIECRERRPDQSTRIAAKKCPVCGAFFMITTKAGSKSYCSRSCHNTTKAKRVTRTRPQCHAEFEVTPSSRKTHCSHSCARRRLWMDPTRRATWQHAMATKSETQIQVASERMRRMNKNAEFRKKGDDARRGKGFVGERGGNGTLTPEQIALVEATGYIPEYPVATGNPKWKCALMDLANPRLKIAVEVDGKTHLYRQQQNRDRIKERMLERLGWVVLRFTNEEINEDINRVVEAIRSVEQSRFIQSIEPIGNLECIGISVASENKLFATADHIVTAASNVAFAVTPEPLTPEPAPETRKVNGVYGDFVFDDIAIAAMRANLAANGMTPEDWLTPKPAPETRKVYGDFVFDDIAIAAMWANLAANGMTLEDWLTPKPAPETRKVYGDFVFDDIAIAAMWANLAANGMTLEDLAC
jgi:Protein of unknown function (DUF559)